MSNRDLFPADAADAAARRVEAVRAEAAILAAEIARGGRAWESASGKAVRRIRAWRAEAADTPAPHGAALLVICSDLAGRLSEWFARHVATDGK